MRLDELRRLVCVGCGRSDVPLHKLAESLWPNARACPVCLERYGRTALATAADQALANATPAQAVRPVIGGRCLHCGQVTIAQADGLMPAWCSSCEADRRRLMT